MDRSLYPSNVEVRKADLVGTESTKIFHLLRRFVDTAQTGVASGFEVTPGAGDGTINVAAGTGYAPNGEFVEVTSTLSSKQVAAYGVQVLVGYMYQETQLRPGAHVNDGTSLPREAARAFVYREFTATTFSALPATYPDDLTVDAQDRFLVIAVIDRTAHASASTVITLADITGPDDITATVTITQPVDITGVTITAIDQTTPPSDPFPAAGAPTVPHLRYNLPAATLQYDSGTGYGAATAALTAPGGTVDVYDNGAAHSITVDYDFESLPIAATTADALEITTLYTRSTGARSAGAVDASHRHATGTSVPSAANPHGLRLDDLAGLLQSLPGTLKFGSGLLVSPEAADSPRGVFPANASTGGSSNQRELVFSWEGNNAPSTATLRLYRRGDDAFELTRNARWNNTTLLWTPDTAGVDASKVGLLTSTAPETFSVFHITAPGGTWDDTVTVTGWDRTTLEHSAFADTTDLGGTLSLGDNLFTTLADAERPRITADYAAGGVNLRTLIFQSVLNTGAGTSAVRVYRVDTAGSPLAQTEGIELVANADWNGFINEWTRAAGASLKLFFNRLMFGMYYRDSALANNWPDTGWTQPFLTTGSTGGLAVENAISAGTTMTAGTSVSSGTFIDAGTFLNAGTHVFAGGPGTVGDGNGAFRFTAARKFRKMVPGIAGAASVAPTLYTAGDPTLGPSYLRMPTGLGSTQVVYWPLELPYGATLTSPVKVHCDVTVGTYVRGAIIRQPITGANTESLTVSGANPYVDFITAGPGVQNITVDVNPIVDSVNYAYSVWMCLDGGGVSTFDIYAIDVEYTVAELALQ